MADLNGDGRRQIITCDDSGDVHVAELNLPENRTVKQYMLSLSKKAVSQPIVFDLGLGGERGILVVTENKVVVLGGGRRRDETANRIIAQDDLPEKVKTAVAPLRFDRGELEFVFGLDNGTMLHYRFADGALTPKAYPFRNVAWN